MSKKCKKRYGTTRGQITQNLLAPVCTPETVPLARTRRLPHALRHLPSPSSSTKAPRRRPKTLSRRPKTRPRWSNTAQEVSKIAPRHSPRRPNAHPRRDLNRFYIQNEDLWLTNSVFDTLSVSLKTLLTIKITRENRSKISNFYRNLKDLRSFRSRRVRNSQ